jgi:arginine/lysine/ornithine decarboxylase
VPDGATIVLPRNVHRSVTAALVLSGARPRFLRHGVSPSCGALGVAPAELERALREEPRPAAVLLTRPSYYGLTSELEPLVEVCRAHQTPLIVDEAHGGHLHFLPPGHPRPALASGADLVVQSCHKTLGSLVGTAQLHVGLKSPIDPARVRNALNLLQSTSPNYLLLASLDAARHNLWQSGPELFRQAVDDARELEDEIDRLPRMTVLRPDRDPRLAGHGRDPLRTVVNVSATGWKGFDVEVFLRTHWQVEDEMADWFNIVLIQSPRDDPAARQRLLAGLRYVSENPRDAKTGANVELMQPPIPPLAMTPRQAALGRQEPVVVDQAVGRTCAEMVMFYPPGIPLLMPGETITPETLAVCRELLAGGAHCYASDVTLGTLRVTEVNLC